MQQARRGGALVFLALVEVLLPLELASVSVIKTRMPALRRGSAVRWRRSSESEFLGSRVFRVLHISSSELAAHSLAGSPVHITNLSSVASASKERVRSQEVRTFSTAAAVLAKKIHPFAMKIADATIRKRKWLGDGGSRFTRVEVTIGVTAARQALSSTHAWYSPPTARSRAPVREEEL